MSPEVWWCVWLLSITGLSAQSSYNRYFGDDNSPQPYMAPPMASGPYIPEARAAAGAQSGSSANDEPASMDSGLPDYGSPGGMSPLGALSVLAPGYTGNPHLEFCRRCPACISCTGIRINPQVKPDAIFLAAFAGPRKHSANLQDLANFALQEHMRKFGLSPLTVSVADCRVRSSAFRGFVKLCECSGMRAPEFQLGFNNMGRMFQVYRKHLAIICDKSLCELTGHLPKGSVTYSFVSNRREFEIPFPDRFPVKIQLEWTVQDQNNNVMVYSIKRAVVLDLIRKASTMTKTIPNSEFVHRVLSNLVEKKFDSCYRFRDVPDISEASRAFAPQAGLGNSGFRDASFGDSVFRDGSFRDGQGDGGMRDYDDARDRGPMPGDYLQIPRERPERRPSGPIYTEL